MVVSRTSADKAALLEQFTGRKIDEKIDLRIAYGDYVQAINPLKDNQVENANTHGCMFSNRFIIAICSARISNIFFHLCHSETDRIADRKRPDVANQHAELTGPVHCFTYARRSNQDVRCDG